MGIIRGQLIACLVDISVLDHILHKRHDHIAELLTFDPSILSITIRHPHNQFVVSWQSSSKFDIFFNGSGLLMARHSSTSSNTSV